jgi:hypothetical protein
MLLSPTFSSQKTLSVFTLPESKIIQRILYKSYLKHTHFAARYNYTFEF